MEHNANTFLETIKAVDGQIFHIDYHQKRYEDVLSSFGINNFKNIQEYLNPPKNGIYRCRLIYTNDNISVSYFKYEKKDIKKLKLIYDDKINYEKKSTSREELDKLYSLRKDCDDIIIVKNSLITDTSIANIAFYNSKEWYTPLKPLLKGTTRQRLLDEKKIIEKDIDVKDLKDYSKIALLNAMIDFDIISKYDLKDIVC